MSAGTPTPVFPIRRKDAAEFERTLQGVAAHYAKSLGIPVALANKCGPLVTELPGMMPMQRTRFPGLSTIADSDGAVKSQLGGEQGIAIAEVVLDPSRKSTAAPKRYGLCPCRGLATFSRLRSRSVGAHTTGTAIGQRAPWRWRVKTPNRGGLVAGLNPLSNKAMLDAIEDDA